MKETTKNDVVLISIIFILMLIMCIFGSSMADKNDELETYKRYYNASEKLFDEIEEGNEAYFDTDRGADYLHIRKEIQSMK
nr:MAG TPA: hypothetical protein [Crassvirales sp.]